MGFGIRGAGTRTMGAGPSSSIIMSVVALIADLPFSYSKGGIYLLNEYRL